MSYQHSADRHPQLLNECYSFAGAPGTPAGVSDVSEESRLLCPFPGCSVSGTPYECSDTEDVQRMLFW